MELLSEEINLLRQNARSIVRELGLLNDAYFDIGVTLAERHLLIELSTREPPTMGEVAESLLLDKSTVSRLISKAVKKGYIKCISDLKDRRKRLLHLTEKGKHTLQAFEPIAFDQTRQALLTLSTDEVNKVYEGISLYALGLKNARLKKKKSPDIAELNKIEALSEIISHLNAKGYVLEKFQKDDEEQLHKIFKQVVESGSEFFYESSSREEFQKQFFSSQNQVYVCRTIGGKVVGGFYLRENYSGRSNHIANAAYMLERTIRGQGVGSLLVKASLHFAKTQGFQAMHFNMVLSKNILAIKLYKKLGFKIVGIIPQAVRNHDATYQDGFVMHRRLDDL